MPNASNPPQFETFELIGDGPIARIRLNRPEKRNTMTPAFWRELPEAVMALSDAGETRVLILEAQGTVFSAGMDISVFTDPNALTTDTASAREAFMTAALALQDAFTAFERARFPVIASVQGPCVGGAVDMICAADMRFGTSDAWLRIEETNIGMFADVGTLQRLPGLIPEGIARELAYTGDTLSPERAEKLGLYNAVFDTPEALDAHVDAIAEKIASKAPLTINGTKRSFLYARDHTVADSLEHAMTLQASLWSPEDILEAMTARGEKRDGVFKPLNPVKRMGRG
ncbi:enoyl-CoA hydratase-related protein [Maricaulaceae bacterium EIL42A08]|nr:enoyl-CoA hydratase-related protein [Maricaulaceae bacterium EIL42A08]